MIYQEFKDIKSKNSKSIDVIESSFNNKIWSSSKTNNIETKHISEELNISIKDNGVVLTKGGFPQHDNEIKLPIARERKNSSRTVLLPPSDQVYPNILAEKYIDDNTIEEAKSVLNDDIKPTTPLIKEENLWALRMEVNYVLLYHIIYAYYIVFFVFF